jgi:hypothetical protein
VPHRRRQPGHPGEPGVAHRTRQGRVRLGDDLADEERVPAVRRCTSAASTPCPARISPTAATLNGSNGNRRASGEEARSPSAATSGWFPGSGSRVAAHTPGQLDRTACRSGRSRAFRRADGQTAAPAEAPGARARATCQPDRTLLDDRATAGPPPRPGPPTETCRRQISRTGDRLDHACCYN